VTEAGRQQALHVALERLRTAVRAATGMLAPTSPPTTPDDLHRQERLTVQY
jgi:hypothetical protein